MQRKFMQIGLAAMGAALFATPALADIPPERQALGSYTVWIVAGVVAVVALGVVALRKKR